MSLHPSALATPALLALAGLVGGAMNAVVGGGSFVTLPALLHAGLPSTAANASSTVGLFPGALASLVSLRGARFEPPTGADPRWLAGLSLVGGGIGAGLLLVTSPAAFDRIVPWLLLAATLALLFGRPRIDAGAPAGGSRAIYPVQFGLGVYGGYFGGAVGLMMSAAWLLLAGGDFKRLTPLRVAMVALANTVAVVVFVAAGAWRPWATLPLLAGAIAGGWIGAKLATRLPAAATRWAVRVFAVVVTVAFFVRAYR